jgi:hypothetical protein
MAPTCRLTHKSAAAQTALFVFVFFVCLDHGVERRHERLQPDKFLIPAVPPWCSGCERWWVFGAWWAGGRGSEGGWWGGVGGGVGWGGALVGWWWGVGGGGVVSGLWEANGTTPQRLVSVDRPTRAYSTEHKQILCTACTQVQAQVEKHRPVVWGGGGAAMHGL